MRQTRILIYVLIPLLLLATLVRAQEKDKWERVYTLEDATIAINSTLVEFNEEGMGRVKFRWNFSKPQSLDGSTKYKTRIETVEFNCDRRRYRLAAYILLDAKGKSVFSKQLDEEESEWKFVKAGGMMDRLFGPACKLIREKRQ